MSLLNKLLAKYGTEDLIPGGLADNLPDDMFDADALEQGIKVEMEHTDDPKLAKEIAKDHLTEDMQYYKKLAKMEGTHAYTQVEASHKEFLLSTLHRLLGNKRYLSDIEGILKRVELTPAELQALHFLANDLTYIAVDKKPWTGGF